MVISVRRALLALPNCSKPLVFKTFCTSHNRSSSSSSTSTSRSFTDHNVHTSNPKLHRKNISTNAGSNIYFASSNQLTPYITEILYNSSISVSADTVKYRTDLLKNVIDTYTYNPSSTQNQRELVKLFQSLRSSLTSKDMAQFLTTAYFVLIGQHIRDGNLKKAVSTHKFIMSLDDDLKPTIRRHQWFNFSRKVLQQHGIESSNALFAIHKLQPISVTQGLFRDFSSSFSTSPNALDTPSVQLWMLRVFCRGDIPTTPWEVFTFRSVIAKLRYTESISHYHKELYRALIRNSRKGNMDFVLLAENSVLECLSNVPDNKNSNTGFDYACAISRAMIVSRSLSPVEEILPFRSPSLENTDKDTPDRRKFHPIIRSFWYNTIYNHKNIPISTFLTHFKNNNIELTPSLTQRLIMKSKNVNELCEYYESLYKMRFSAFLDIPFREHELTISTSLPDTVAPNLKTRFYAHAIKLLCQNNVKTAQTIMSDPVAFNDPELVRGFLIGMQNSGKYRRLVEYCERTLVKSTNQEVLSCFWMYYLPALVHVRKIEAAAFLMTGILQKKLKALYRKHNSFAIDTSLVSSKPEAIVRAPSTISKIELENFDDSMLVNVTLPRSVFDFVVDSMMVYKRTDSAHKNLPSKNPICKEYTPTEIIRVLKLGFTVSQLGFGIKNKGPDALSAFEQPYQLSPQKFMKLLTQIQLRKVVLNRKEFIDLFAGILSIYPNYYDSHRLPNHGTTHAHSHVSSGLEMIDSGESKSYINPKYLSWYKYPAGTYFRSSFFSNDIVERVIYIGILLSPSKIWWILSYIQHLSRALNLKVDKKHVKTILLDSISQIYGYDEVSGELSRVRNQTCNKTSLQILVDILNMIWSGSTLEETEAFLKQKGVNTEKLIKAQLMQLDFKREEIGGMN